VNVDEKTLDPFPFIVRDDRLVVAPLNSITIVSEVALRSDLRLHTHQRSVYVLGIDVNSILVAFDVSTLFAISLHVVAISAPLSHIHGLVSCQAALIP
jgi:hypothetical protein